MILCLSEKQMDYFIQLLGPIAEKAGEAVYIHATTGTTLWWWEYSTELYCRI